jgi:polysaccharide export outer membrane protein
MTSLEKPIGFRPHDASGAHPSRGERRRTALMHLLLLLIVTGCLTACQSSSPQAPGSLPGVSEDAFSTNSMRLREGDVIHITFENATNLNSVQTIPLDGFITLQLVGQTKAAGKTTVELEATLTNLYQSQIKATEIQVSRVSSAATYSIGGAVLKPGKFPLDRPLTVLEAVMEAGGVDTTRAKLSEVIVLRIENNQRVKHHVDLKRALQGKELNLFYLRAFDIIYVPQKTFNF